MKTISSIHIYPVKSLGGFSVTSAIVTPKGLQYDRNWMCIDADGKFMTQRTLPQMSQILTAIKEGKLLLTHKGTQEQISIDIEEKYGTTIASKVWSNDCEVERVEGLVNDFLSEHIGQKCQLVYFPKENIRTKKIETGIEKNLVSLADKSPILLTNELSLQEFNTHLDTPITMEHFRPNIVYQGNTAWEEDDFKVFQIGKTRFRPVEICGRCILINVNPATGQSSKAPLKTLATYRKSPLDNQVKFGLRCAISNKERTVIKVGQELSTVTCNIFAAS